FSAVQHAILTSDLSFKIVPKLPGLKRAFAERFSLFDDDHPSQANFARFRDGEQIFRQRQPIIEMSGVGQRQQETIGTLLGSVVHKASRSGTRRFLMSVSQR